MFSCVSLCLCVCVCVHARFGGAVLSPHKTTCILGLLGVGLLTLNRLNTGGDGFLCCIVQVGKWYNSQVMLV